MTFQPCKLSYDSTHLSLFYNEVSHKVYSHHLELVVPFFDTYVHVAIKPIAVGSVVSFPDQLLFEDEKRYLDLVVGSKKQQDKYVNYMKYFPTRN